MTPVTPVPAINNSNNNTSTKEELPWSQTDNDDDNHIFAHVIIAILGLKSEDVLDPDDGSSIIDTHPFMISSVNTSQALMTFVTI